MASALFLKARGARVTVSDAKPPDQLREEIPLLLDHGIAVETGGHGERTFRGQDLIVVSPGVPVDAPPLVQARALGRTRHRRDRTGGAVSSRAASSPSPVRTGRPQPRLWRAKSSPPAAFGRGRRQHRHAGDLPGRTSAALTPSSCSKSRASSWRPSRHFVPRLRSCSTSRPTTSTAIARSQTYIDAKARIFENQQPDDFAVLNADDPTCVGLGRSHAGTSLLVQPQERSENRARMSAMAGSCFAMPRASARSCWSPRFRLKAPTTSKTCWPRVCVGALLGCEPATNPQGGSRLQSRRAPAGIRGHDSRRRVLQRLQGHQRGRDHQGAGIVPREYPPDSRRQGQRQRLHRAQRSAARSG